MFTRTVASLRLAQKDDDQGFTLIELMVVVLIIAILIAIAIPTFLGARNRAQDRAAQSSLRNALTAAKTAYTDTSDYAGATQPGLAAIEPSLTYSPGAASSGFKNISIIAAPSGQVWWAAVLSKSGKCFGIKDNSSAGGTGTTYIGGITAYPAGGCTAPAAAPAWADVSW